MEIEWNNPNSIRSRYILLDLSGFDGQYIYEAKGEISLPAELQTFSEYGLPWIDKSILRAYERPRIFSLLAANMESGGFLPEIEDFLKRSCPFELGMWQMILYCSGLYENAYRPYQSTKNLFLYDVNKEERKQLICIDQDFLVAASSVIHNIIFAQSPKPTVFIRHFLRNVLQGDEKLDRFLSVSKFRRALHRTSPDNIDKLNSIFRLNNSNIKDLRNLYDIGISNDIKEEVVTVVNRINKTSWTDDHLLWRFIRSIVFHFTAGHELGHIAYSRSRETALHKQFIETIKNNTNLLEYDVLEECFCDFIAIHNCFHQAKVFQIPPLLVVVCILTAWFLAVKPSTDLSASSIHGKRLMSVYSSCISFIEREDRERFFGQFSSLVSMMAPGIACICDFLRIVAEVNLLLNPSDECRVRTLNKPGDSVMTLELVPFHGAS